MYTKNNINKHEMNFIPNKHKLKRVIFIQYREFPERKERERDNFCVINVKYKEISWRVRKEKKKWKKVTSRSTE